MKANRVPKEDQLRIIMECRASGLSDYEWCLQNNINPGTFYNWVKRLRQKGCTDIPDAIGKHIPNKQEVVKVEFPIMTSQPVAAPVQPEMTQFTQNAFMELSISGAVLQIHNGTDPVLLKQTLCFLKELSC